MDQQLKLNKDDIAVAIDSSNNTASDKVPSCAAVAAYVDSNISGALDTTVTGNSSASTISISNKTNGLCAVRITKMSDGSTQYQSNVKLNRPVNKTTAFIFNITASEPYMIEAWSYNSSTEKLIPTAVKYV